MKYFFVKISFIIANVRNESIKVFYTTQGNTSDVFENEISILRKLNKKFPNNAVEKGIVKLVASGNVKSWKHKDDAETLPGRCAAFVYTYTAPLFPVLKHFFQNNDRTMLFWFFSQMVRTANVRLNL